MIKRILFWSLILTVLQVGLVYAMAQKPNPNTFQGCMQEPYQSCAQYGNPWAPNASFQKDKWYECALKKYEACRCKYGKQTATDVCS